MAEVTQDKTKANTLILSQINSILKSLFPLKSRLVSMEARMCNICFTIMLWSGVWFLIKPQIGTPLMAIS